MPTEQGCGTGGSIGHDDAHPGQTWAGTSEGHRSRCRVGVESRHGEVWAYNRNREELSLLGEHQAMHWGSLARIAFSGLVKCQARILGRACVPAATFSFREVDHESASYLRESGSIRFANR